jgi:hypothetical protein
MAFSPDGKRLLSIGGIECGVWDLETGKRISTALPEYLPLPREKEGVR